MMHDEVNTNSLKHNWVAIIFFIGLVIFPSVFFGTKMSVNANSKHVVVYSEGDYILWVEDSITRVSKDTIVSANPSLIDPSVSIDAARNEYESFQLVFRSTNHSSFLYRQFKLSFSNLIPDATSVTPGNTTINSTNIDWYKVNYVMDEVDIGYADEMIKSWSHVMILRQNHPYWIDIYVPDSSGSGDYVSNVSVSMVDREAEIFQLKLHVYNFTIPKQHSIVNTFGVSNIEEKTNMLLDRRISPYHVATQSYVINNTNYSGIGNNFTFNWTQYDIDTENAIAKGLDSFVVNFWASSFPEFTGEFNQTMRNWYKQMGDHLYIKGWLDLAYIYIIDEPGEDELHRVKNAFDLVHAGHSGLRTMITANPDEKSLPILEESVDIWCPGIHAYNTTIVKELQSKDKEFWAYPCLYPKVPFFNFMIQNQLMDTRLYYWKTFSDGLDGALYWSVDWYHYCHGGIGFNGMGDGILIYDTSDNHFAPSLRLQAIRDGIEDLEYFNLYKIKTSGSGAEYTIFQADLAKFSDVSGLSRFNGIAIKDFRVEIAQLIES